MDILVIYLFY